jgi:glutamine amidotransferase
VPNLNITLLDYGMANLLNVARAFEHCGATVKIVDNVESVASADRLVVPGVGAFEQVLYEIRSRYFDEAIRDFCKSSKPLMGICVGMQMLFEGSEEFGTHAGLGVMQGTVREIPRFTVDGLAQRVPHIGWSHLVVPEYGRDWGDTLLRPFIGQNPAFYFVHSFSAQPEKPGDRLADCMYGGHRICSAVQRDNVVATQFHPERSGEAGLTLIREFLKW